MNWSTQIKLPNGSNVNSPDSLVGVRRFAGRIKFIDNEAASSTLDAGADRGLYHGNGR